jgi:TolB-like protein
MAAPPVHVPQLEAKLDLLLRLDAEVKTRRRLAECMGLKSISNFTAWARGTDTWPADHVPSRRFLSLADAFEIPAHWLQAKSIDEFEASLLERYEQSRSWQTDETTDLPAQNMVPIFLVEALEPAGDIDTASDFADELKHEFAMVLARREGIKVATDRANGSDYDYVLGGRCRVTDDRYSLQLSMVAAPTGQCIWAHRLTGVLTKIDDAVRNVARLVSGELRTTINAYAGADAASLADNELDLNGLLSKAAFLFYRFDPKSTELSRVTMEHAIRKGPDNPMANAMMAWSLGHMVPFLEESPQDVDIDRVMRLSDRAVDLGPRVDFVYHNRAWQRLWLKHDHDGCIADARRTQEINPDYHKGPQDQAIAEIFRGDIRTGIARLEDFMSKAPSEPVMPLILSLVGLGYLLIGDEANALRFAEDGYERRPMIRVHSLVYAAVAASEREITSTSDFRALVERNKLTVSTAEQLPFRNANDLETFVARLQLAGLPHDS